MPTEKTRYFVEVRHPKFNTDLGCARDLQDRFQKSMLLIIKAHGKETDTAIFQIIEDPLDTFVRVQSNNLDALTSAAMAQLMFYQTIKPAKKELGIPYSLNFWEEEG